MISKNEAKDKISKLVELFKKDLESGKANKYTEEETKVKYIQPLFEALGWDFGAKSDDISLEEKISGKRVDYGFRINGIPKFYVEAKKVKGNLEKAEFAEQAINYAWHKGCTWAILTDFETLKIFNSEWKYKGDPSINKFKEIKYWDYIERFNELWLLSKESMGINELDKIAEKVGKKIKKQDVGKQIYNDLLKWRTALSKDIVKQNPKKFNINSDELDEVVQRILDRFIFIRTVEDRGIHTDVKLIEIVRDFEKRKKGKIIKKINELFNEYDTVFNSKLFQSGHFSEQVEVSNEVLFKIIKGLYHTEDKSIHYDFAAINADVLGNMYEQYLGHLLKKTEKRAKIEKSKTKIKDEGIYYTPPYIVDYIVRNTVGEYIKGRNKKTVEKIKILDPACGSGSFLIRAFDEVNDYWKRNLKHEISNNLSRKQQKKEVVKLYGQAKLSLDADISITKKIEILKNNIYGVDLDEQAAEIARLNLLIKAAEKKHLLPALDQNIKIGNSLIDDPSVAGNKAFKWEEEFEAIMKDGGFDLIIGNPPWVALKGKQKKVNLSEEELEYLLNKYTCDKYRPNLFEIFIWKGLELLKEGGYLAFIVPDRICYNVQYTGIRKYILENFSIKKILFKPIFEGVISDNIIFIIEKKSPNEKTNIDIAEYPSIIFKKIPQKTYLNLSDFSWFFIDKNILNIFEKIKKSNRVFELSKKFCTKVGFIAAPNSLYKEKSDKYIKVLKGENIRRYNNNGNYWFEFKKENLVGGTQDIKKLGKKYKIFIRKTGADIIATFDDSGIYPEQSLYFIYTEEDVNSNELKYISALLNSKLLNCYYKNFAITNRDATPQLKKIDLDTFPIIIDENYNISLVKLVEEILLLNKKINLIGNKNTDEKMKLEVQIKKLDDEINELVYKIYGITEEEKRIIEESLNE